MKNLTKKQVEAKRVERNRRRREMRALVKASNPDQYIHDEHENEKRNPLVAILVIVGILVCMCVLSSYAG